MHEMEGNHAEKKEEFLETDSSRFCGDVSGNDGTGNRTGER